MQTQITSFAGERVLIRKPEESDCDAYLEIVCRSRAFHRPWVYPLNARAEFLEYVGYCWSARQAAFLVFRLDDDTAVGFINLVMWHTQFRAAYVSFFADAAHSGQGYMTEALWLCLTYAFGILRLHRIEAMIQPGNTRGIALVQRTGFTLEGVARRCLKVGGRWRDHGRWALLSEDWRAIRGDDTSSVA